jgi:hypothetical protein
MEFKEALSRLEESSTFKKWVEKNRDNYLSYAFCELSPAKDEWQIGYYNEKEEKVTTFIIGDSIGMVPPQDVFKEKGAKVNKVNLDKVKLSFSEIVDRASEFQKEKYPAEDSDRAIAILQNIEGVGTVWNITFVTKAFKTLNMKLGAETGEVVGHELSSVFDLRKS